MCFVCRFHLKEFPHYKYQPRKRPSTVVGGGHDSSAGTKSRFVKRLRTKSGRRKASRMVPRCETPVSTTGSEFSELAESYLSSDWSVAGDLDEDDLELEIDPNACDLQSENTSCTVSISSLALCPTTSITRNTTTPKDPPSVFPTGCGRSYNTMEAFDWMEDYVTPEVAALLADDWFAAADSICLRDVTVM